MPRKTEPKPGRPTDSAEKRLVVVQMPAKLVAQIDAEAAINGQSRAEWLRRAAEYVLSVNK